MSDDFNVVKLTGQSSVRVKPLAPDDPIYCNHKRIWVVEKDRMLQCRDCETWLDPFDRWLKLAKEESSRYTNIRYAKIEERRLADSLKDLKRQIRNAKAQLSRIKKESQGE